MKVAGKKKVEQILATGAGYVAAPCANCKRQVDQLMEYHKLDVNVGGVFDLLNRAILFDKPRRTGIPVKPVPEAAAPQGQSHAIREAYENTPEEAMNGIRLKSVPKRNALSGQSEATGGSTTTATAQQISGIGLCASFCEQGDWAFDYALSLAKRTQSTLNIYRFLESPYTLQRDVVFVDAEKTKTAKVTPELIAEKDKELRFLYDERLGDYDNVGFPGL